MSRIGNKPIDIPPGVKIEQKGQFISVEGPLGQLKIDSLPGIKVEVDPARLRPSDVTLQIPCIDKFCQTTGWEPEIKFEQTLKDTLNYWRRFFLARAYSESIVEK